MAFKRENSKINAINVTGKNNTDNNLDNEKLNKELNNSDSNNLNKESNNESNNESKKISEMAISRTIKPKKTRVTFNLEKKNKKKKVVSYYFKENTVEKVKEFAEKYDMKDSAFIETILEQFFESQK